MNKVNDYDILRLEILLNDVNTNDISSKKSIPRNINTSKQISYPFLILFMYGLSLIISFIFGHLHGSPIKNYFEALYYLFSLYTLIFKFIMKWIGLRCDEWREINSNNNYLFSIEYFMEFYWDLTYWMIYRYYTIFNVPSATIFILTLSFHLSWEFFAVFVRLTPKYFKLSTYLTLHSIPLSCMDYIFDNCNFDEWRDRVSMDVAIKLGCSVCSGLFFGINLVVNGSIYDDVGTNDKFSTTVWYFSVSLIVELSFYVAIMLTQSLLYNYSISKPFVLYIRGLTNKHRFFLLLLFGSVIIPVF